MADRKQAPKISLGLMPALGRLNPLAQRVVLLAAAAGVIAAAWLLLWGPLYQASRRESARLAELNAMIEEAHQLTSQAAAHQAAFSEAQAAFQNVYSRIGGQQTVPRILEALGHQAKQHRLKLVAIQPDDDDTPDLYAVDDRVTVRAVPIRLHLKGRYQQLGQFLGDLSAAPFLASVEGVSVSRPGLDSPELEADLMVSVYLTEGAST